MTSDCFWYSIIEMYVCVQECVYLCVCMYVYNFRKEGD